MITNKAFFGDAVRSFALTDDMILELEAKTGHGIGTLYQRAVSMTFGLAEITETLRLALIGGGASPEEAHRTINTWAINRPIAETLPIVLDVLDLRWNGPTETSPDNTAAATGDLAGAINADD